MHAPPGARPPLCPLQPPTQPPTLEGAAACAQMCKVVGQAAVLASLAFFIYEVVAKLTFSTNYFLTHRNLIMINTVVASLCVAALAGTGIALLVRTLRVVRCVGACRAPQ